MTNITLGLDLGPSSIGWALVDEANHSIIDLGVRIFPEGVDRDQQGGEKSKSQTRRVARGMRRQIARRSQRKKDLRDLLIAHGLLSSEPDTLESDLEINPYPLRARALDDKLTLHELGRILIHLNQRRGFQSNRKTDRGDKEAKGMLAEISELDEAIKKSGCRTVGQYFATLHAKHDAHTSAHDSIVRGRHTRRDMYKTEFDLIWESQKQYHPDSLTEDLKTAIKRIIFFQRKMYWPKSVIGRCELEPKLKRCPRADRAGQRFRMLQEINNLQYLDRDTGEERKLSESQRSTLVDYLASGRERTFVQIRKKLGLSDSVQFNFERGDRKKLKGHVTDALLSSKKGLGKIWKGIPDDTKDRIVDILIHETDEDEALIALTEDCSLQPDEAERAANLHLPDGHYNFSRLAIDKLLPHLERGLLLMADDATNSAMHAAGYLRPDEREVSTHDYLPPAPDLTNPIVRQAVVEVRKVVNNIIREHGRPVRIHVELARDAKLSFNERKEVRFENAKRRKLREDAASIVEENNAKPSRRTVNRLLLWKEQEEYCPYCGRKISITQLFNGDADIDHILPRWRSLDDSLANKIICHRSCNAEKGDKTPREWLEDTDPDRYQKMLNVAEKLSYGKQKKFRQKDIVLSDFIERQLRDTAYISRCVSQYLKCLGAVVSCPRGSMTADLRHWWGLNNILDTEGKGRKIRGDHRHHAVDALVLALTDAKRLHALANARGENMPMPWSGFLNDARSAVLDTKISHRSQKRLQGALHEATLYGPTSKSSRNHGSDHRPWAGHWIEDPNTFVRRKAVTELTNLKHLEKIRDTTIRDLLKQHLRNQGVDVEKGGTIPKDAFKGEKTPKMPSGVPIRRVRMIVESQTIRPVSERRPRQYVKPGNNHHIVYRATGEGDDEKWTAEVVTMWDAATRARNDNLSLVDTSDKPEGRFVVSLAIGEMFEIDDEHGNRTLCVVRKIEQRSKRLDYKIHTDARESGEINKDNLYLFVNKMKQLNVRKVNVDPLGRIRHAND